MHTQHRKSNRGEDPPPIEIPARLRVKLYAAIKDPMKRVELLRSWYDLIQVMYREEGQHAVDDWVEKELESLDDLIFENAKAKGQAKRQADVDFYSKLATPTLPFVLSLVMAAIHHF